MATQESTWRNIISVSAGRKPRAAAAAAKAEAADRLKSDAAAAVIVFGKDESGKAHASWIAAGEAEVAIKAAGLMGFQVLRVTSPDIATRALELAQSRVFASGRGLCAVLQDAAVTGAVLLPGRLCATPARARTATFGHRHAAARQFGGKAAKPTTAKIHNSGRRAGFREFKD